MLVFTSYSAVISYASGGILSAAQKCVSVLAISVFMK